VVGRWNADIADTLHLRVVVMATIFWLSAHWRHLANTTEPSICGGDAALCQITLTSCYITRYLLHSLDTFVELPL